MPTSTDAAPIHYELKEITELLIKQNKFHEGLYDLAIEFQFSIGGININNSTAIPGASFGINRIGIIKVNEKSPHTVDAAVVNPTKETKTGSRKKQA